VVDRIVHADRVRELADFLAPHLVLERRVRLALLAPVDGYESALAW
jgi:hypothetical protein